MPSLPSLRFMKNWLKLGIPLVRRMQNDHRLHRISCDGKSSSLAMANKTNLRSTGSHRFLNLIRWSDENDSEKSQFLLNKIDYTCYSFSLNPKCYVMSVLCLLRQLRVQNFQLAKRLFSCIKVRPGSKGRFQGSRNGLKWGSPRSFILMGFSLINHPFGGSPFLETPTGPCSKKNHDSLDKKKRLKRFNQESLRHWQTTSFSSSSSLENARIYGPQ